MHARNARKQFTCLLNIFAINYVIAMPVHCSYNAWKKIFGIKSLGESN